MCHLRRCQHHSFNRNFFRSRKINSSLVLQFFYFSAFVLAEHWTGVRCMWASQRTNGWNELSFLSINYFRMVVAVHDIGLVRNIHIARSPSFERFLVWLFFSLVVRSLVGWFVGSFGSGRLRACIDVFLSQPIVCLVFAIFIFRTHFVAIKCCVYFSYCLFVHLMRVAFFTLFFFVFFFLCFLMFAFVLCALFFAPNNSIVRCWFFSLLFTRFPLLSCHDFRPANWSECVHIFFFRAVSCVCVLREQ